MIKLSYNFSSILSQPLSPEQFSLTVSAGVICGIFPIFGLTTIVCVIVALALRLNMVVMQVINYAVYPLQLILIIPFMEFGTLLSNDGSFALSLTELIELLDHDTWTTLKQLWLAYLLAIVAWLLAALPLSIVIYFSMLPIFKRLQKKTATGVEKTDQKTASSSKLSWH